MQLHRWEKEENEYLMDAERKILYCIEYIFSHASAVASPICVDIYVRFLTRQKKEDRE